MKEAVLLLSAVCCVSGGGVAWPGAIPIAASVRTVIPPQIKGFAYSTSQYINAVPPSYTIGYQPQISYQVPEFGVYPTYPGFSWNQPVLAPQYYPGASQLYPSSTPVGLPIAPSPPVSSQPSPVSPSQEPAGDEDTAVIESAEYAFGQQGQPQPGALQGIQTASYTGSYDTKNLPGFPQIEQVKGKPQTPQIPQVPQIPQAPQIPQVPQIPQAPQFPQVPQIPQAPQIPQVPQIPQAPQFPQIPQIPQFPSGSGFPQFPLPPQFIPNPPTPRPPSQTQPSAPQPSFPSGSTGTQSLNDEDTIAVESA